MTVLLKVLKRILILSLRQIIFPLAMLLLFSGVAPGQTPSITFSEINYNSDSTRSAGDWVELHNYGTTTINISNWIFTDSDFTHFFVIPSVTELAAGEYLVLCQDNNKFISRHPSVTNFAGPFYFGLSGKGELIRLIDNQNNILLSMTYKDSLPWPEGADGKGRTLELIDPLGDLNDDQNWFDGCMGGSPGTNYTPCSEAIIFSEINYNSNTIFDAGDWVELRNISLQPVDVSGWIFRDKKDTNTFVIPSNTIIAAGNHLVLAENSGKFFSVFPTTTNVVGSFGFGLKSFNETLRLYDPQGNIYLSVAYYNIPPWPTEADGQGYTLELTDSSGKLNDGNNWFYGCIGGSPGNYYSTPCELNVREENMLISSSIYPNPFSTNAYLELNTNIKGEVGLLIYDALGKTAFSPYIFKIDQETNVTSPIRIPVDGRTLTPGIYFYRINYKGETIGSGKLAIIK